MWELYVCGSPTYQLPCLPNPTFILLSDPTPIPPTTLTTGGSPIYFGIDCRSERERQLGSFPKAYSIDPSAVSMTGRRNPYT